MSFSAEDIIYEDNHLLVIRKPAGVLSQEDYSGDKDVLTEVKKYIKVRDNKPGNVYMGLVHRLDRNTGGVMCLAKTSKAASRLSEQIRKRTWTKEYLSLNENKGHMHFDNNWTYLEDYLHKDKVINKVDLSRQSKKNSKKATLKTRVLASKKLDNGKEVLLRQNILISGRTHQIRAQLAARNQAILGDYKYGASKDFNLDKYFLGLWAYALELEHPTKKNRMRFTVNPPTIYPWNLFDYEKLGEKYE